MRRRPERVSRCVCAMNETRCASLIEFCQGPCVANQGKVIEAGGIDIAPKLLWWLTRQQMLLKHGSTEGMTVELRHLRTERLKGLMGAEMSCVDLLLAVVESSTTDATANMVASLCKELPRHELGEATTGIDVLVTNMNLCAAAVPPLIYSTSTFAVR